MVELPKVADGVMHSSCANCPARINYSICSEEKLDGRRYRRPINCPLIKQTSSKTAEEMLKGILRARN
ncbi:MAG: hypothetical protein GYA62_10775 [Bacteroidales bacterium]|nr:hypothetical protein [Bacteroidales bacterium]